MSFHKKMVLVEQSTFSALAAVEGRTPSPKLCWSCVLNADFKASTDG